MDEAQQVPNQNSMTPVSPIATYPTPQPAPISQTPWMLISLIVILLGVASYFGYQNYQLNQQLTRQQSTSAPSATINSPSPLPISSAVTDPTTSWIKYSDNLNNFTFKYPNSWQDFPLNTISDSIIELKSLETNMIAKGVFIDGGPDHGVQDPKMVFKIIKFKNIDNIDTWVQDRKSGGEVHAKVSNTLKINNYLFSEVVGLGTVGGCTKDWFIKIPSGGYLSFIIEPYNSDCSAISANTSADTIVKQVLDTFQYTK